MKARRILNVLGNVNDAYIEELFAEEEAKPQRHSVKKVWLIAAIVAVMLVLVGCAVVYVLSLDDLKVGEENIQEVDSPEATEVEDFISLQGFMGSKNYQAAKEWYEFRQIYDPDGKILQSLSNKETMMPDEYWSYNCYTPEMVAKVDEICEKYALNKLGMATFVDLEEHFYEMLHIDRIVREDAQAEINISPVYFYKTGSFMLSCDTKLTGENTPWIYPIEYQYRCVMKSDFDDVFLNIGEIESYDQWEYTTWEGTEVLLAIAPDKALVIVDMENFFVTMNIMNPRVGDVVQGEQMMPREALEAFADTFDFSFVPQPVSDADWKAEQERQENREENYQEAMKSIGGEDYAGRVEYLQENASRPEMLDYALHDINGDGVDELLIARRKKIIFIYTMEGDITTNLLEDTVSRYFYHYGWEKSGLYQGYSFMCLCEGNAVACVWEDHNNNRMVWHFAVPVEGEMVWMEEIAWELFKNDVSYYEFTQEEGSNKGYNDICTPISEERYAEIMSFYPRVDVEWTPLSEYPIE